MGSFLLNEINHFPKNTNFVNCLPNHPHNQQKSVNLLTVKIVETSFKIIFQISKNRNVLILILGIK